MALATASRSGQGRIMVKRPSRHRVARRGLSPRNGPETEGERLERAERQRLADERREREEARSAENNRAI